MVETRSALAAQAGTSHGVREIAGAVNRSLAGTKGTPRIVTMFLAKLDPVRRTLHYCSAGHCPGLLVRDGHVQLLDVGGVPLGITGEADYEEGSLELGSGDVLLIHTDGVTEAVNREDRMFGSERLHAVLERVAGGKTAEEVLKAIWVGLADFTGGVGLQDDTTMVCIVAG